MPQLQQHMDADFVFDSKRLRVQWELLSSVDPEHVAHTTDIDALESVLHLLTHGDFAGTAEPADLGRVVYLMQLALQYLLYVQEQLASENATLRSTDSSGRQAALQLRVAELKQRLTLTQHELKRYRRTNKTYEYLATAAAAADSANTATTTNNTAAPQPSTSEDVSHHHDVLQQQLADTQEQLQSVQQQLALVQQQATKDSHAAAHNHAAATDTIRRLQAQVQQLQHEARSQPTIAAQLNAMQQQWHDALARQQALQEEKDAAELELMTLRKAREADQHTLASTAQLEQQLTDAHREVQSLQQALAQHQRRFGVTGVSSGATAGGGGMGQHGHEEVQALRQQVATLEQQLRDARAAIASSSPTTSTSRDWRNDEIDRLQAEVQRLVEQNTQLKQQTQALLQRCGNAEQESTTLRQAVTMLETQCDGLQQQLSSVDKMQAPMQAPIQAPSVMPTTTMHPSPTVMTAPLPAEDRGNKKTLLGKLSQGWNWRGKNKQPEAPLTPLVQQPVSVASFVGQPGTVLQQSWATNPGQPGQTEPIVQPAAMPPQHVEAPPTVPSPVALEPVPPSITPPASVPTPTPPAPTAPTPAPTLPAPTPPIIELPIKAGPPSAEHTDFSIKAGWIAPATYPGDPVVLDLTQEPQAPPASPPALAVSSAADDDLFGGFMQEPTVVAVPPSERTLKPVRSIIKTSSFTERGLQKSPSGRRVAFNLPDGTGGMTE